MIFDLLWMWLVCEGKRHEFIKSNSQTAATVMCWFSWKTENVENQTRHLINSTSGFVCNRSWSFRFVLEVCGCWWQCCGGMFVGAQPVLEQRTDKSFLKSYQIFIFLWSYAPVICNPCPPPHPTYGDSGANVQGNDLLSSPAVLGKCRACDIS